MGIFYLNQQTFPNPSTVLPFLKYAITYQSYGVNKGQILASKL